MGNATVKIIRAMQSALLKRRLKGKNGRLYIDLVDIQRDIQYTEGCGEFHLLDVLSPKGTQGKLPVIIVMHGGGYVACCKETNLLQSRYFATRGFHVVNINYRLMPEVGFKEVMRDLFAVFEWIGKSAEEYNFDIKQVFLTGDSAGGHFVLLAAALLTSERLRELYGVKLPPYELSRIAATCPAVDTKSITEPKTRIDKAIAGAFDKKSIETMRAFPYSGMYQVVELSQYPRVFIITTPQDSLLYGETKRFHEYLGQRGVSHIYKEYQSAGHRLEHVFNVTFPGWDESIEANEDIISYFLTGELKKS